MPLFVPKDRKSLFRQFLAGMYDAVVITDPNGHILEVNRRAVEHFGYNEDEVVDRPISFFIPGLAPEIVKRIRKGLDDGHHMMIDANGLNKDGSKFFCEVTVSMIDLMEPTISFLRFETSSAAAASTACSVPRSGPSSFRGPRFSHATAKGVSPM